MVTILGLNCFHFSFHLFSSQCDLLVRYNFLKMFLFLFFFAHNIQIVSNYYQEQSKRGLTVSSARKPQKTVSLCVSFLVSKMATCRGITYLWWLVAAPDPPASGRKSSAGPGCTECEVPAAFPKVWTNDWTNSSSLHPRLSHRPSSTWPRCSVAPQLSLAPSVHAAL